jgi:hypothetical protein
MAAEARLRLVEIYPMGARQHMGSREARDTRSDDGDMHDEFTRVLPEFRRRQRLCGCRDAGTGGQDPTIE